MHLRPPISVDIKLTADAARVAKDNISVLYFVKLVPPYLGMDFLHATPKIDSPSDVELVTYHVYANVLAIWVVNGVTGEI